MNETYLVKSIERVSKSDVHCRDGVIRTQSPLSTAQGVKESKLVYLYFFSLIILRNNVHLRTWKILKTVKLDEVCAKLCNTSKRG